MRQDFNAKDLGADLWSVGVFLGTEWLRASSKRAPPNNTKYWNSDHVGLSPGGSRGSQWNTGSKDHSKVLARHAGELHRVPIIPDKFGIGCATRRTLQKLFLDVFEVHKSCQKPKTDKQGPLLLFSWSTVSSLSRWTAHVCRYLGRWWACLKC